MIKNRRVAETATSRRCFGLGRLAVAWWADFSADLYFVNPTQGGVIPASLESLALGYIVERLRRRKQEKAQHQKAPAKEPDGWRGVPSLARQAAIGMFPSC